MYHITANIDERFRNEEEAFCYYANHIFIPRVPVTHMQGEDSVTKRICVAPTIEDCLSGIGLTGRLHRCLAANEDALSYVTAGREMYPILIAEFSDFEEYYSPTPEQVPDVGMTNEHWILNRAIPESVEIVWLNMFSILWDNSYCPRCRSVKLYWRPLPDATHPWLNGMGHTLDSSEYESYGQAV